MILPFDRYLRVTRRPITGRRLAAARRALQRQADKVALFPELQPTQSASERIMAIEDENAAMVQRWRNKRAADWCRARREFRALPRGWQIAVFRRYALNEFMPKDPVYLLETIRAVKLNHNYD